MVWYMSYISIKLLQKIKVKTNKKQTVRCPHLLSHFRSQETALPHPLPTTLDCVPVKGLGICSRGQGSGKTLLECELDRTPEVCQHFGKVLRLLVKNLGLRQW